LLRLGEPHRGDRRRGTAEQAVLAARPLLGRAGGVGENDLRRSEDRRAVRKDRIERACSGKALDLATVQQPRIDTLGEIVQ
jgi:hypothetical protein